MFETLEDRRMFSATVGGDDQAIQTGGVKPIPPIYFDQPKQVVRDDSQLNVASTGTMIPNEH